jgi:hypothetical protein
MCVWSAIAGKISGSAAAVGDYYSAMAEAKSLMFESGLNIRQAGIKDWQAQDALSRGEFSAGQLANKALAALGAGQTAFAASNVVLNSGSAGRWAAGMISGATADIGQLRQNAAMDAWGLNQEADTLREQAAFQRQQAKYTRKAAQWQLASGMLFRSS